MSFYALLNHRCDFYDQKTVDDDGSPVTKYVKVNSRPVRCRLDLTLVRAGKDSLWMSSAARPTDRTAVLMLPPNVDLKSGMRISMTRGPKGVFQIQGAIDEVWDYDSLHHLEVGVQEVASLQFRGSLTKEIGS